MEIALYIIAAVATVIWVWLNALATFAVKFDSTLERFQVISQIVFVWLIPYFGATLVLHLVWQHFPHAIPQSWVPWPFKQVIYGKAPTPKLYENDGEFTVSDGHFSDHWHDASSHHNGDGGDGDS